MNCVVELGVRKIQFNMSFEGKVVLITGGSSGIGADAARHLAKLGARVAIVGRNEGRLNAVADEIRSANGIDPLAIVADVNFDTKRIIDETIKHFGQLDVLVNNAGFGDAHDSMIDIDMDGFDRILNTNLRSVVKLTKLAVAHLEKAKGNVVNISSNAGLRPYVGFFSYCISKSALDQFTKCAALELAPKGIRVNSLNPGTIDTPFFQAAGYDRKTTEEMLEYERPLGRTGLVSDTSAAIAFLASDNASFLTGVLLPVDGGEILV